MCTYIALYAPCMRQCGTQTQTFYVCLIAQGHVDRSPMLQQPMARPGTYGRPGQGMGGQQQQQPQQALNPQHMAAQQAVPQHYRQQQQQQQQYAQQQQQHGGVQDYVDVFSEYVALYFSELPFVVFSRSGSSFFAVEGRKMNAGTWRLVVLGLLPLALLVEWT